METTIKFKAHKVSVEGKSWEEVEAEVRATNEANIQAIKDQESLEE